MAEYIDREAIFRAYMDLCKAKSRLAKANGHGAGALVGENLYPEVEPTTKEVFRMIMAMPAADVVKVVKEKPQTNADLIRAMSDEALAELLLDGCRGSTCSDQSHNDYGSVDCFKCRMDWLKQPAKDGGD